MIPDVAGRRVLLLQGPVGPFFARFAAELRRRGAEVTKVNFNGGDALFFRGRGDDVVSFRAPLATWPAAFRRLVAERRPDLVFLFGDCRPIHRAVIPIAGELGVAVWVFEEGYLRPDWVTLEAGGVNGNSPMPRDPATYRRAAAAYPELRPAIPVGNTFRPMAAYAVLAAIATTFGRWRFPHYRHHRDVNAFRQLALWLRGGVRKLRHAVAERGALAELVGRRSGRYFLVPLQVHSDSQFQHSPFADSEAFLATVIAGFAAHAPPDAHLVIKQHPLDRPYRDYARAIAVLAARHACAERITYVHDLHLPTLLKHARGVIAMNSTVGTSALYHGTPVKVLGRAIYDIPGLTFAGPLADFVVDPGTVDEALLAGFHRYLAAHNQINGSFYRRVEGLGTLAGLDASAFSPASPPRAARGG